MEYPVLRQPRDTAITIESAFGRDTAVGLPGGMPGRVLPEIPLGETMAVVPLPSSQCVIWFGKPLRHERDALGAAGWQVRAAGAEDGIGLRGGDSVVGLLDLRDNSAGCLDQLEHLTLDHDYLSLIAVVPGSGEHHARHRLLDQCEAILTAPLDLSRLIHALGRLTQAPRGDRAHALDALIGKSPAMRSVHGAIRKFAPVDLPVLVTGDTGTGKDVAARALHDLSGRRNARFMAINCGALTPSLMQSELFGHERGAFTGASARRSGLFETADGGTVFLDEIGNLPLDAQSNLLRVLQDHSLQRVGSHEPVPVDVRVLAATNLDLEAAVAEGTFRSDLFYRLNVLRLHLPPLHERGRDIVLLAEHFLQRFREKNQTRARAFSAGARQAMLGFAWPGHVRELINRVQRAAVIAEAELITANELDLDGASATPAGNGALELAREAAEREAILACLHDSGFNISETARRLKVARVTVYRLCRKHGLDLAELR